MSVLVRTFRGSVAYQMLYNLMKRLFNPDHRILLWVGITVVYISTQHLLYGQQPTTSLPQSGTPWEHLTLEGALALAVSVQYRENREKERIAKELATQIAGTIATQNALMGDFMKAVERLSEKVDQCPVKLKG